MSLWGCSYKVLGLGPRLVDVGATFCRVCTSLSLLSGGFWPKEVAKEGHLLQTYPSWLVLLLVTCALVRKSQKTIPGKAGLCLGTAL